MKLLQTISILAAAMYFSCPVVAVDPVFHPTHGRLRPGDQYRLFFVTSTTRDATSSDIEDYNGFVQAAADAAPIVGSWDLRWEAIASTDAIAARDNTNTNPLVDIGLPIYRLDGRPIWSNNEHLWGREFEGGPFNHPFYLPNITELGTLYTESVFPFSYAAVWTGTSFDGSIEARPEHPTTGALGNNVVIIGSANLSGQPVRATPTNEVHLELPLYAISEVITVVPEPSGLAALTTLGIFFFAFRKHIVVRI